MVTSPSKRQEFQRQFSKGLGKKKKKKLSSSFGISPGMNNEQEASKTPDGFTNVQCLLYWPILTLSPFTEQKALC